MPCSRIKTTNWVQRLRVGLDHRDYTVQLDRQIGCCRREAYRLYVNNQEIEDHSLTFNPCSPACCDGGQFEFEQDGHTFLVIFDAYSFTKKSGEFRLFIDGTDVNSGLEYSAFWRRRGWHVITLAVFLLFLGIALSMIFVFLKLHWSIALRFGPAFGVAAIIYFVIGVMLILRHRRPRNFGAGADELQPRTF